MTQPLPNNDQTELFWLRLEKAVQAGVKTGLSEHVEVYHKPLKDEIAALKKDQQDTSQKVWMASGAAGGVTGIFFILWNLFRGH